MKALKRKTVSRFVIKAIAEELVIPEEEKGKVVPTANLARDLGADELDRLSIVLRLERKFLVDISGRELEELKTVQDVINLFSERTESVAAEAVSQLN